MNQQIFRVGIRIDGVYYQTTDTMSEALAWLTRRVLATYPWNGGTLLELTEFRMIYDPGAHK